MRRNRPRERFTSTGANGARSVFSRPPPYPRLHARQLHRFSVADFSPPAAQERLRGARARALINRSVSSLVLDPAGIQPTHVREKPLSTLGPPDSCYIGRLPVSPTLRVSSIKDHEPGFFSFVCDANGFCIFFLIQWHFGSFILAILEPLFRDIPNFSEITGYTSYFY